MSKPNVQRFFAAALSVLLILSVASGCGRGGGGKNDPNVDYYTCSMHPSVRANDPGKCPICGMELVPVMQWGAGQTPGADGAAKTEGKQDMAGMPGMAAPKADGSGAELNEFSVPLQRQQQIGVTYAEAKRQPLHHTIRSVGFIVSDKGRRFGYVSRVAGYVHKLHVTSPGELVEKDEPLLTIYSPDLLTTERELVNALELRDWATSPAARQSAQRLIDSAGFRLRQWNVTEEQIAELEKSRQPSELLTLRSPFKGRVEEVPVEQGRKVVEGDRLVELADLSLVWLWAEFYEDELSMLQKGQKVTITSNAHRGEKFEGEISVLDPFLNEATRTGKVRIDIPNPDLKLRPGAYANVELAMDMGEGLTVPVSAIMPTGTRNLVFIDKGEGKLEPRLVELGRKFGDLYEVQSGLEAGERVVSSANFLIDAESKVQGAVKMLDREMRTGEPTGVRPGPLTAQPGPAEAAPPLPVPLGPEARPLYDAFFDTYLGIQKQLAQDKFDGINVRAAALRQQTEALLASDVLPPKERDVYRARLEALQKSVAKFQPANLEQARIQFGHLSWDLVALITQFPPPLERALRSMHCPMWKKSPGCWIQVGEETENPFFGQSMLTCGNEIKSLADIK